MDPLTHTLVGASLAQTGLGRVRLGTATCVISANLVEHHYADNGGVRIHYVTLGEGPVVLFIHGFPNQDRQ